MVVKEFLQNKAFILKENQQKNTYLEHAAKIIRHDMHSGINTYLPRGIKSLKRRLSEEQIKELKIGSPLKLIEDGLHHAQKVYAGVYEFTNLVKEHAELNKKEYNVKVILGEYLKLTAYKNQVMLDDNLPKDILIKYARKKGQKESGTGLGLNISIEILRKHGFSVFAEKQKQGTKISIRL